MSIAPEPVSPAPQAHRRRWPKLLAIAGVVVCALALVAWAIHRHFTPDWSENALGENFGADHPWTGNTIRPFMLEGEATDVLLGLVHRPDNPLAPTYVVLIKKPVPRPSGIGSRSGGASIDVAFTMKSGVGWSYPSGETLSVEYEQRREPFGESFLIDGQSYPLESGRVFLVDLAAQPHKITQVDADIRETVLGQNWQRRQREEAKKAIEQLRTRYPVVQEFLLSNR
jgi:hypothetical protein